MVADVEFTSASVALRPPRVAMLIPVDHHWRNWAMTALTIASGYWGGGGFIVVPYDNRSGKADPSFAEIVRAYDPDHVVTIQTPLPTWEDWYPGTISVSGVADEEERRRLIANAHGDTTDTAAQSARAEVASWCSPMRAAWYAGDGRERQRETMTTIARRSDDDRLSHGLAPNPAPLPGARLAASADWRSDVGLLAAMRVGVAQTEMEERPEPPIDDLEWLVYHRDQDAPTSFIWNNEDVPTTVTANLRSWFFAEQRLVQVSNNYSPDRGAIVIGDTGSDFALALAYDRIIGNGVWLSRALLDDDDIYRRQIESPIWWLKTDIERGAHHIAVTSTSVSKKYLAAAFKKLCEPRFGFHMPAHSADEQVARLGRPTVGAGYLGYIVNEHVGVPMSFPVSLLPDGSVEALYGLYAPIPTNLVHGERSGWVPYWYVDVTFEKDATPRGRDLPAAALVVPEGPWLSVNIRASQETVTYDPHSMGFVSGGAFMSGRVGRPKLRGLSMRAWAEAMAEPEGLGVRLSSAGRQAELVRRRLGSRGALLDLVTPESLPMLRAFIPLKRPLQKEERDPSIVVLGKDPYLSFEAMDARSPGDAEQTVALVDTLTTARLLRRGLILNCVECGRPSFMDADRVGQEYECPQCAASNVLSSHRWSTKSSRTTEPTWFYDLFNVFRDLLGAHGDVSVLAAAALRSGAQRYLDAPELEFFDPRNDKAVAEIDVVASVDRDVVLVEAKSTAGFEMGQRVSRSNKLLRIARILRADRIVLATSQDHWNADDVEYLSVRGAKVSPFPVTVEVKTGLDDL